MAGSYELYAEVLRRAAVKVAGEIGWELEPSRAQFLPDSVAYWMPFRESNAAMDRIAQALRGRDRLQHRRQAARRLAAPPAHRARPRRHRAAGAQLQARPRPLQGDRAAASAARRAGSTSRCGYYTDVAPLLKMNVPVIWVNRHGEKLEGAQDARPPRSRPSATRRRSSAPAPSRRGRDAPAPTIPPTRRWSRARTSASRRARDGRARPRGAAPGALPNLIVIGGLKCGTTSLHHYLGLHPADRRCRGRRS